jgi:hypothetical protein
MKPIFYTEIQLEAGTEKELVKLAHTLGYELVKFNGYSAEELGWAGFKGIKREEAKQNLEATEEVLDAFASKIGVENVHMAILHTEPCVKCGKHCLGC